MAHYRATIDVDAPRDVVWDHLHDFATAEQWDPGVVRARQKTRGSVRMGTRYQLTVRVLGLPVPFTYDVVGFAPRHVVSLESGNRLVSLVDTIRFSDTPTGTRVEYTADLTPRGPLGVTDPLWQAAFDRIAAAGEAGLRRWLADLAERWADGAATPAAAAAA